VWAVGEGESRERVFGTGSVGELSRKETEGGLVDVPRRYLTAKGGEGTAGERCGLEQPSGELVDDEGEGKDNPCGIVEIAAERRRGGQGHRRTITVLRHDEHREWWREQAEPVWRVSISYLPLSAHQSAS
jgi:hypothetical protein